MSLQMLSNTDGLFTIPVRSSGCLAAGMVDGLSDGHVAAVFSSSFYVQTQEGLVCIGNETMNSSPLNLVTQAPASTNWPASGIRLRDPVRISSRTLRVANRFSFSCSSASRWYPPRNSVMPDAVAMKRGLAVFRAACISHLPADGLGRFIIPGYRPGRDNPVAHAAQGTVTALRRWLGSSLDRPQQAPAIRIPDICPLLGLGPGLTPSGDDFLGGIMIALHALEETDFGVQLWDRIHTCSNQVCGPISYAHLSAASKGMGSDALHDAMNAVMNGDREFGHTLLHGIDAIGHTSGWDAMAGVVTVLDEWASRAGNHSQLQ